MISRRNIFKGINMSREAYGRANEAGARGLDHDLTMQKLEKADDADLESALKNVLQFAEKHEKYNLFRNTEDARKIWKAAFTVYGQGDAELFDKVGSMLLHGAFPFDAKFDRRAALDAREMLIERGLTSMPKTKEQAAALIERAAIELKGMRPF